MKRNLMLLVILLALLGVYWMVQSKKPVVATARPFAEFDSARVTLLRIATATDTVELTKQGEQWRLTFPLDYPAAQATVHSALSRLVQLEKLSLISTKPERSAEFEVDDALGTQVTLGQGGQGNTATYYFGKTGPAGGTGYARYAGTDEIWEISGNPAPTFKRPARDWRDKTITELQAEEIVKLTFIYPHETFSVSREDTLWKIETAKASFVDASNQVSRVTNLLSRMAAVDFADTLAATAFDKPELRLQAELAGGDVIDLKLLPKDADGNQYYLRKAGAAADFVIYKSTAAVLIKKADDFKAKPNAS